MQERNEAARLQGGIGASTTAPENGRASKAAPAELCVAGLLVASLWLAPALAAAPGSFSVSGSVPATWTWVQRNLPVPAARYAHGMAYDAARARVVLFGGTLGSGGVADTWTWDGTNWTLPSPAVSPPGPQRSSAGL